MDICIQIKQKEIASQLNDKFKGGILNETKKRSLSYFPTRIEISCFNKVSIKYSPFCHTR